MTTATHQSHNSQNARCHLSRAQSNNSLRVRRMPFLSWWSSHLLLVCLLTVQQFTPTTSQSDYLLSEDVLNYVDVVAQLQDYASNPDLSSLIQQNLGGTLDFSRMSYYWETPYSATFDDSQFSQVLMGRKQNACYAVFHGIDSSGGAFVSNPQALPNNNQLSCRAHWDFVESNVPQYWSALQQEMVTCMENCNARFLDCDLVLGGFGTGGSVATLLSFHFANNDNNGLNDYDPYVISFGSSNVLYDKNCPGINQDRYFRFINTDTPSSGSKFGICFDDVSFYGNGELVDVGHTIVLGIESSGSGMVLALGGSGQLALMDDNARRSSLCHSAHSQQVYLQKLQLMYPRNPYGVTPVGFSNSQYCEVDNDCRSDAACLQPSGSSFPECMDQTVVETPRPTPQPTAAPTPRPTVRPTPQPTVRPTPMPTVRPTPFPTSRPPSRAPTTGRPTDLPTRSPTDFPTRFPTFAPTDNPTLMPTNVIKTSRPTNEPTDGPTSTPTMEPTDSPTSEPTTPLTAEPTNSAPTMTPSVAPAKSMTSSPSASPSIWTDPEDDTSAPTYPPGYPSVSPTISDILKEPPTAIDETTATPTTTLISATTTTVPTEVQTTPPLYNEFFSVTLVLKGVTNKLSGFTVFLWEDETSEHIRKWIDNDTQENNWDPPMEQLRVQANIVTQSLLFSTVKPQISRSSSSSSAFFGEEDNQKGSPSTKKKPNRSRRDRRFRRKLQATSTTSFPDSLEIAFEVAVSYRTLNTDQIDLLNLIRQAFQSGKGREQYARRLLDSGDESFATMTDFILQIQEDVNPNALEIQDTGGENKAIVWSLIGAAVAAVIVSILLFVWYLKRVDKKKKRKTVAESTATGPNGGEQALFEPATSADIHLNPDGSKICRLSHEIVVDNDQDDCVSTLEDPFFPMNSGINSLTDEERTASVQLAQNYMGVHNYDDNNRAVRMGPNGTRMLSDPSMIHTVSSSSGLGLSKIGSGLSSNINEISAIFADNDSFEEQFAGQDECFEVSVPPGKLGIIIDLSEDSGEPMIRAIRGDSALAHKVKIGDRLLSVDGQGCTEMSAEQVSKLIAVKSNQSSRKIMFVRRQSDCM